MRRLLKLKVLFLALAAVQLSVTAVYAQTLSWSLSGTDVSGSGTMTATNEGGGAYLVTAMSGNIFITVGTTTEGGAITGFTQFTGPWVPGAFETSPTVDGQAYAYDDIVYPFSTPALDSYGLVFDLSGFSGQFNLFAAAGTNCSLGGSDPLLCNAADQIYDNVTFNATVPEGGNAAMYLVLAAGSLFGAMGFRSRHYLSMSR